MSKPEFSRLIRQVKESKPNKTIQKIIPEKQLNTNEKQFSFYIDKDLLRQLKSYALQEEKSIKSIINESIKSYLNRH